MTSGVYAENFSAYTNTRNINNAIQEKINNVAENELLFSTVDYSQAYDSIIQNYEDNLEKIQEQQQNSSGTEGAEGTDTEGSDTEGTQETASDGGTRATEEQIAQLRATFEDVQDEQGWVGKAWDGIKNFFGHKNGSKAVEETISKAESGEISYEEAVERLNKYAQKQDSVVDTFANVASGLAVAAGVIAAPLSFGASLALGAAAGAAVKVGIKGTDAATNNVEGDYTLKNAAKDTITGGVGGLVTAATAGIGTAGVAIAKESGKVLVKETIKQGVIAGAKAGAIDGAVMGATNYTADAVFDGQEFTFGGLVGNTATSAMGGALIGGTVGGVTAGFRAHGANKGAAAAANDAADAAGDATQTTGAASAADDAAGAAGKAADDAASTLDKELLAYRQQAQNMTTAQKREYIENLVKDGKITSEDEFLKFFDGNVGVAKTTMGSSKHYREIIKSFKTTSSSGAGAADDAAGAAAQSGKTISETLNKARENLFNLFKKGAKIKDMSPKDVREAFTGRAGASLKEFKTAYEAMKETNEYKTNLVFRTFIEDLFNIGAREDV